MGSQPEAGTWNLLPWPRAVDRGAGAIRLPAARLDPTFDDVHTERLERAVARLAEDLSGRTGLPGGEGEALPIRIRCGAEGGRCPGIEEDESYWLVADDAGVFLDAASEWGVLRGLVTLGQLVTVEGLLPHVAIDDRPRFPWRGLLLDPARHFLPAQALTRTLEGMARCKLNVLHLHLSDDQGFRFPVEAYPRLASAAAYTRAELESVVAFAADRGIRVVPEIDMPGHVTSWLVSYPEWGGRQVGAAERFGVHPACLNPANESVYQAVGAILDALVAVFPDPCIHVGGDEVAPTWWSEDESVAALMAREGLARARDVQAYFNLRVGELVKDRGRRVLGWDEVLDPALPSDWIVQAWRGATARDRALARGNDVVVSAPYYLDLNYPVDVHYAFDPADPQERGIALEDGLLDDPRLEHVAEGIAWTRQWREGAVEGAQEGPGRVLGGEACLWGELVTDDLLDLRLWTRLPALAERFWSPREQDDVGDLHRRLDNYLDGFAPGGRNLGDRLEETLARLGIGPGWRPLVDMLEPVKWYRRLLGAEALAARLRGAEMPRSRPYDVRSPLDGLVDHLPVESRPARAVAALAAAAAGEDDPAGHALAQVAAGWQALAERAPEAPAGLEELAAKLAKLGELVQRRLEQGMAADAEALVDLGSPVGEMMIALPRDLRDWLTGG